MNIHPEATIGTGCQIEPTAQIAKCTIGNNVRINIGANISKECVIEDDVTIDSGVILGVNCHIQRGSAIYSGVTLGHHCKLGHNVIVSEGCRLAFGVLLEHYVRLHPNCLLGVNSSVGIRSRIDFANFRLPDKMVLNDCTKFNEQILFMQGSKDLATEIGVQMIKIGCQVHCLDTWLSDYRKMGISFGYSKESIREYYGFLTAVKRKYDTYPDRIARTVE